MSKWTDYDQSLCPMCDELAPMAIRNGNRTTRYCPDCEFSWTVRDDEPFGLAPGPTSGTAVGRRAPKGRLP